MTQLDREETTRKVQQMLVDVLNLERTPRLEDRLAEDLGVESIDVLSLLFELEDAFGRAIPDERVAALVTVGDVVDEIVDGPGA